MFQVTIGSINTKERRDSGVQFLRRAEGVKPKSSVEEVDLNIGEKILR